MPVPVIQVRDFATKTKICIRHGSSVHAPHADVLACTPDRIKNQRPESTPTAQAPERTICILLRTPVA